MSYLDYIFAGRWIPSYKEIIGTYHESPRHILCSPRSILHTNIIGRYVEPPALIFVSCASEPSFSCCANTCIFFRRDIPHQDCLVSNVFIMFSL
jgi:hypothetical protein